MSDENKMRDALDAAKGFIEAVPIYEDALQPAAREVGTALQTVAKTIHIVLAPLKIMVWGYEQIEEFLSTRVAEKLRHVPTERVKMPEPHVVVPAMQALRYTYHQEELRELYANLLATSLDADTCERAHPAFVDVIKNMAPDEARIMRLFSVKARLPVTELRVHLKDQTGYQIAKRRFSLIGQEAGCVFPHLTPTYLDNLERLGLIESPGAYGLGSPTLAGTNAYEPLEKAEEVVFLQNEVTTRGGNVQFGHSFVQVTDFGAQFCRACVIEQSAPGGAS